MHTKSKVCSEETCEHGDRLAPLNDTMFKYIVMLMLNFLIT